MNDLVRVPPPRALPARRPPYAVVRRFDVELIGVVGREGRQVWSRCRARKAHACRNCLVAIAIGQRLYRPLTNQNNRMDRICVACGEVLPVEGAVDVEGWVIS